MVCKLITLIFSLIILTQTLAAKETGTLYLKKVKGKIGWFESGDEKKHLKYTGDIVKGKPYGFGELITPSGKYTGEFKNGLMHGQVTQTYKNGKKREGEFRKGKPWNVKGYDKNGKIEKEWVNGKKLLLESNGLTGDESKKETGTLYLKKVKGKIGWFESGDEKKHLKYTGDIVKGKPYGFGELITPSGKYTGEFKNGLMHGQVTQTYKNGKKREGEFRKGKPWNVKGYDKNGKIEKEWVNGKKLKKITESHLFKLRFSYGLFSVDTASSATTSIGFIWNGWGLGLSNEDYIDDRTGEKLEFQNQFMELSYTFDLSDLIYDSMTMTLGFGMPSGEGKITSSTNTVYNSSTVSGYTLFSLFGIDYKSFEVLAGFRLNNITYSEFESSSSSNTLDGDYTAWGGQPILGLGYNF